MPGDLLGGVCENVLGGGFYSELDLMRTQPNLTFDPQHKRSYIHSKLF